MLAVKFQQAISWSTAPDKIVVVAGLVLLLTKRLPTEIPAIVIELLQIGNVPEGVTLAVISVAA